MLRWSCISCCQDHSRVCRYLRAWTFYGSARPKDLVFFTKMKIAWYPGMVMS